MAKTRKRKRLVDAYRFAGFRPLEFVGGVFGDPWARVVTLVRRSKKPCARNVAGSTLAGTTEQSGALAICPLARCGSIWNSRFVGLSADAAAK